MVKICAADPAHISALAAIERAAADLFSEQDLPAGVREETVPPEQHLAAQREGLLLVAIEGETPVGYAVNQRVGDHLHLLQIDVHPRHQRQGIGTALLRQVETLALASRCVGITLTTFSHVPWNGPWYQSQGFCILPREDQPPYIRDTLEQEQKKGLDHRVAMLKPLP